MSSAPKSKAASSAQGADELAGVQAVWTCAGRCVALGGAIGLAVMMSLEILLAWDAFGSFFADNNIGLDRRMVMLARMGAGAGVGVALALGSLIHRYVNGLPLAEVERRLWLFSPLIALPLVPAVMAVDSWRDRHDKLLPVVLLGYGLVEVLVFRALLAAPKTSAVNLRALAHAVPQFLRKHAPTLVVWASALFYAVFISFYQVRWHQKLRTANFDLSIANNLMFNALHGRWMSSTVAFADDPDAYLGAHANFGQYVILPIYALIPRVETLLVVQSALLGLAALPLYGFAVRHISRWKAAAVAVAYLCYYPLHSANFSEVKYSTIACFFILMTVWAIETRRWVIFAFMFPSALLMREDIPIGLAVAGAFMLVTGYRPRIGLFVAAVSTAWFVVLRFYIMEKAGDWWFPSMYEKLFSPGSKGFQSVIKTLASNPLFVLTNIIEERKIYYVLHLLVPIAFLPARRWYLWAAFIPGTIITLLATDYKPPAMFSFQYVMFWIPYLFLAAVLAVRALERSIDNGPVRARAALVAMLFASAALSYNYGAFAARNGSLRGGYKKIEFTMTPEERTRYAHVRELAAMIPPEASVAATEYVGPHVSSRLVLYAARYGPRDAEYMLASSLELDLKKTKTGLKDALDKGEYGVIKRIEDLALLKRGADPKANADLIRDWGLDD
jgi:uncharacterized membrane protein